MSISGGRVFLDIQPSSAYTFLILKQVLINNATEPEEIAAAICELIENLVKRRKIASNGLSTIESELGSHYMKKVMK